jgi:succinoglycan biosynthesis transport protein ExoP
MSEDAEAPSAEPFDVQRYLDLVRRRHRYLLVSVLVGWLVVWGASWVLPPTYKSSTLILVEQPTMPKDYVTPNVTEDLQGRMQNITQQILSRTRLVHIIDQLNLYPAGSHSHVTPDEKVEKMRKDIKIELVRDTQEHITAFKIYYSAHDAKVAQQVTSELTRLFIDENLEVRQKESEDTTKFLQNRLDAARQSLAEQEAKVRVFKSQHVGDLPSQQASNLQILSGLQSQLQNEEDALNSAQQQRIYLQSLISQYRAFQVAPRSSDGAPTGLPAIDQELEKLRARLADLSSHYTDQYPDIRNLKIQIAKTEKMRDQLVVELRSSKETSSQSGEADAHELGDPLRNSARLQLEGQLNANQVEVGDRERAIASLKDRVGEYQARLNQEPASEQQLADLTRGYDQSKANYDELLKKENESQMATSMEQMQQGERFRMLDPPSLPLKPDFPNRLAFCGIGVAFGLMLGVVVVGGSEFLDDRVYGEKELNVILSTNVIAEIPEILSHSDEQTRKKHTWIGWALASTVLCLILLGSAISYLRG